MRDVLHWLGVTRIHRFASMSDMKCDALVRQGIQIDERVPLPDGCRLPTRASRSRRRSRPAISPATVRAVCRSDVGRGLFE